MYEIALGLFGGVYGWLFSAYAVAQHRYADEGREANHRTVYMSLILVILIWMLSWISVPLRDLDEWGFVFGGIVGCIGYGLTVIGNLRQREWSLGRLLLFREPTAAESSVQGIRLGLTLLVASGTLLLLVLLLQPCTWLDRTLGLSGCRVALEFDGRLDELAINHVADVAAVTVADDIVFIDLHTGEQEEFNGIPYEPRSPRWSADGQQLAVISSSPVPETGDTVLVVEYATLTIVEQFSIPKTYALEWSPDGRFIAGTGGLDTTPWVWDRSTDSLTTIVVNDAAAVANTVAWSPDGRYLLGWGGYESAPWLWDRTTQQVVRTWPQDMVTLAWTADGEGIVSVMSGGSIKTQPLESEQVIAEQQVEPINYLFDIEQMTNNRLLVHTRDINGRYHMNVIGTERELQSTQHGADTQIKLESGQHINDLAFAPAVGRYMVNILDGEKSVLTLRSVDDPTVVYNWTIRTFIFDLALTADGTMAVLDGGDMLYIWELP